jgi:hypothetical protein
VTSDDGNDRPGRATSPAFSYPVKRDFDGGLLQRWTYVLTRRDALAYLRLRREWPAHLKVAFGVLCLAGGAIWGLSPWADAGPLGLIATESVLILAAFLGRDLWRRVQAARLVPRPVPGVLEEWVDCIAGTELGTNEEAYLSPELIGEVLLTRTHLFIRNYTTTIVVPRTALGDEAQAVADYISQLSRGPYYFDAPLDDDAAAL